MFVAPAPCAKSPARWSLRTAKHPGAIEFLGRPRAVGSIAHTAPWDGPPPKHTLGDLRARLRGRVAASSSRAVRAMGGSSDAPSNQANESGLPTLKPPGPAFSSQLSLLLFHISVNVLSIVT